MLAVYARNFRKIGWGLALAAFLLPNLGTAEERDDTHLKNLGYFQFTVGQNAPKEKEPLPRKKGRCFKLGRDIAILLGAASVTALGPSVYRQIEARIQGDEYIGHGIRFNLDKILSTLTDEENKLLKDPVKNRYAIVEMFNSKLWGDFEGGIPDQESYFEKI